ncbi:AAA family ATPase [Candidatus Uhrbacteria bacterium]|nr:AAA family ATPase [Candidatus Uhrbacteria bacterium]
MPWGSIAAVVAIVAIFGYLIWRRSRGGEVQTKGGFTQDLTALAKAGKLETVIGMDEVIERVLHVIARKSKNNPLLIGEPGVGKTAVVEGIAQRIVKGDVPEIFKDKRILSLNLADLLTGTKYRGELEGRLRQLLVDLERDERKNILFIDEIHMLEQARGSEGALDMADILKPALSRGALQVIGATTWHEYETFLKPDAALDRRFQPVLVEEPSRDSTIAILKGVKADYEAFHNVCIPDKTIEAAVDASMRFINDRFLPDKAFDVIDEASAKVSLEAHPPHAAALGLVHAAAKEVRQNCEAGVPTVTEQNVKDIAQQWEHHRTRPTKA